ncbi:MAG: hypothetical protein ACC645_02240 [Pirellulales bacterium]
MAVIEFHAMVLGDGALRLMGKERMKTSSGKLLGDQEYTDFLIREGMEDGFAARLVGTDLTVDWTGQIGMTVFRLGQVQGLTGGCGSITMICGFASDKLLTVVRSGGFDCRRVGDVLSRRLGGQWTVSLSERGQRVVITAVHHGD